MVVLAMVCFTAILSVNGLWVGADGEGWKQTIQSDAKGYYGYLQALFIRHDLGHEAFVTEYVQLTPDGTLNKYFCGTSLFMAPWFAVGHALALGDPASPQNGTSAYEQKAISIGVWVYLACGLLALRALLLGLGLRDSVIAWLLAGLSVGTPLLQFGAFQPGWSHVYSFCAVSCFLFAVHRLALRSSLAWTVSAAVLLALIVLIRPVNLLVVLAIPVVAGASTSALFSRLWQQPRTWFLATLCFALVVAIQPLLWHAQTGHWLEWGYKGEGFHWARPEIAKVLFGFRRGLFLWTPFLLLAAISVVLLWRRDRTRSIWSVLYWTANTYIISSWWIWYYGSGFGARVFIDHYPVFVIPLALVLHHVHGGWWSTARFFIAACIALNLAQMWQFHNGILHHESMDRNKYQYSFLQFDDAHKGRLGGNYQVPLFHPNGMEMILEETCGMDDSCSFWSGGRRVPWEFAFSPATVCTIDPFTEFGLLFEASTDTLPVGRALYLEVGLQRFDPRFESSLSMLAITEVVNETDSAYFYEPFPLNPTPGIPGYWEQLEYRIPVPPLAPGDRLRFYFWNRDKNAEVLIDDVFMRVSAANPY